MHVDRLKDMLKYVSCFGFPRYSNGSNLLLFFLIEGIIKCNFWPILTAWPYIRWNLHSKQGSSVTVCICVSSTSLQCVLRLTVMAYGCWAEDCIRLAALPELAQLVLTKRVCSAILWGERLTSANAAAYTNSHILSTVVKNTFENAQQ